MIQAVMVAPGRIEFREVEKPSPREREVLIQIKRIGVCGSDIHEFNGLHPYTSYPVVQGHEVSGVISAVGKDIEGYSKGDKVTFMPQITCSQCYPCQHGMYHICDSLRVRGFQAEGAAQEFFDIDASKVLKVSESVTFDHAALVEPISVAVHALSKGGDVKGKNVVVLGAGTIGNLVGKVAKVLGAEAVLITDIRDYKLEKARHCGLDFAAAVLDRFGPDRSDLILECVGIEETIAQAIQNARKGTTIVVVGVFGKKPRLDLGLVQDRELSLVGTLMYQKADYERAIELISNGKMRLDDLISAWYAFKEYMNAYRAIEDARGDIMKVMIVLD